ncbi:hypothetical protein GCM10010915_28600 [Microbacterium faecale]|uniref:Uncharacterized protein n=1 Tax=Microbacterium faecale TaxID=1804630 RepID=A0A916YI05_9MICO|nr:hypothetical protein GCM10010915_28600 [Microbacterium faecale]
MIAATIDPTREGDGLTDVRGSERASGVGAQHFYDPSGEAKGTARSYPQRLWRRPDCGAGGGSMLSAARFADPSPAAASGLPLAARGFSPGTHVHAMGSVDVAHDGSETT